MWKEPWMPRSTDFFLRGDQGDRPRWVSQLIRRGEWIEGAVGKLMEGDDLAKVLVLPLSHRGMEDKLIWNHTHCGHYLTSSGYKCAHEMKKNGELRGKAGEEQLRRG
ncbi:hypothetical protein LIER_09828 [Lithospermum erythrorhizon]|uniref:Uncharacterized protein n=1 Tax=Lithospermum erythrorhizon TaxID=34254 RepID=A0AAV3PIT0_LITER